MTRRFGMTVAAGILAASVVAGGVGGTDEEVVRVSPEREGLRMEPLSESDVSKLAPRTVPALGEKALSEAVAEKAAAQAAKVGKGSGTVETYIVPRDWFVPMGPDASWGFYPPDFYIEDDGDLVIFPHLDSGYETCCFHSSFGSWHSTLLQIPGVQYAQEMIFSYRLSRANEWPGSKIVTPHIRMRTNSGDLQLAGTSHLISIDPATALPDKNESRWYDLSLFPLNGMTNDYFITDLDIVATDPEDSADIGWKIKDDVIITVYF